MKKQPHKIPGLSCPQCNGFIPVSVKQILTSESLFCPICGYKLKLDKKENKL